MELTGEVLHKWWSLYHIHFFTSGIHFLLSLHQIQFCITEFHYLYDKYLTSSDNTFEFIFASLHLNNGKFPSVQSKILVP